MYERPAQRNDIMISAWRYVEQSEDGVRMVKYIRRDINADASRRADRALDIVPQLITVLTECTHLPAGSALPSA